MDKKKIGIALLIVAIAAAVYFFVIKKKPGNTEIDKQIDKMPASSPQDEAAYQQLKAAFLQMSDGKDWDWLVKTVKERVQDPSKIPSVYAPFDGYVKTTALYSTIAQGWLEFSEGGQKAGEGAYKYASGYNYRTTSDTLYNMWVTGRTQTVYAGY